MSAQAASEYAAATRAEPDSPGLILLGTGTVGSAFVTRWQSLARRGLGLPRFATLANSRCTVGCDGNASRALISAREASPGNPCRSDVSRELLPICQDRKLATHVATTFGNGFPVLRAGDFIVDATASDAVAARHAEWLAQGVHVITANKLGSGADLLRAQGITRAQREGDARYGDAATVGAGLPVLRSICELVAGGDRIHAVEGVLSGSLAWLFDAFDGMRPFSGFVRAARDAGFTEPDPRVDLSGEDVRRKLLILARAAGFALDAHEVDVTSLVPAVLASVDVQTLDMHLGVLDAPLRERFQAARRDGGRLCYVGRFEADGGGRVKASVGLRTLPVDHALCAGNGTDNRVAITSDRYRDQRLVIQGPGAGAEVTAAALIDDVLRIARER